MNDRYYLGIDTSAYTTSLAVIDDHDNIILDCREVLKVRVGERGLRQQEAIFQHINNLPMMIKTLTEEIDINMIYSIACSTKPRNLKESYMPSFIAGKNQAFILARVLGCEYGEYSHQDGHIGAGMMNDMIKDQKRFLGIHISGGTTELLLVENIDKKLSVEIIGGTLDLNFGQLIDRIGIELGLNFPCGKEMDAIAQNGDMLPLNIPVNIKDGTWFNISGLENYFKGLINKSGYPTEDILATLFNTISRIIYEIVIYSSVQYDTEYVLITGGVSSNTLFRRALKKDLDARGIKLTLTRGKLCTDNGVGIAYLNKEGYSVGDKNGF